MISKRFLLDTSYVQALLNENDQRHSRAVRLFPQVRDAKEVWITSAILTEIGDGLSRLNRIGAVRFIRQCHTTRVIQVVYVDEVLLARGYELYRNRMDQEWGLTDCVSFVLMREKHITDAMTADQHYVQAGFRALMLEQP